VKLFMDSANLDQIRKYKDMHLLDGVTTNNVVFQGPKRQRGVEETRRLRSGL